MNSGKVHGGAKEDILQLPKSPDIRKFLCAHALRWRLQILQVKSRIRNGDKSEKTLTTGANLLSNQRTRTRTRTRTTTTTTTTTTSSPSRRSRKISPPEYQPPQQPPWRKMQGWGTRDPIALVYGILYLPT